jgi:hypothetical protein
MLPDFAKEFVAETRSAFCPKMGDIQPHGHGGTSRDHDPDHLMETWPSRPRQLQNLFASSAACFFPWSIMSSALPSHVCSTVIAVILRTPIKWSQNSMYFVT